MNQLSKWDMAEYFTAVDIAALILGLDSNFDDDPSKLRPAIQRVVNAYESALSEIIFDLDIEGVTRPPDATNTHLFSKRLMFATNYNGDPGKWNRAVLGWILDDDESSIEHQTFSRAEICRWINATGISSIYSFKKDDSKSKSPNIIDKPLNQKEKNTMLKIILGMALISYKYDPTDSKSTISKEISDDLIRCNLDVTAETIRKYLKEAKTNLLEPY